MSTNTNEFLTDLGGGVFEQKVSQAMSDVAAAVIDNERKGKLTLTFDFKSISQSQVMVAHSIKYEKPTRNGRSIEEDTTQTPMYVGPGGHTSFFPLDQTQLFTKTGQVTETQE